MTGGTDLGLSPASLSSAVDLLLGVFLGSLSWLSDFFDDVLERWILFWNFHAFVWSFLFWPCSLSIFRRALDSALLVRLRVPLFFWPHWSLTSQSNQVRHFLQIYVYSWFHVIDALQLALHFPRQSVSVSVHSDTFRLGIVFPVFFSSGPPHLTLILVYKRLFSSPFLFLCMSTAPLPSVFAFHGRPFEFLLDFFWASVEWVQLRRAMK